MRTTLLASATLFGLAFMPAAFAQTAAPDTAPPADTATPTPPAAAPTDQAAPPKHHHHHFAAVSGGTSAHEPGTGESGPASAKASNIDAADSHSAIAPHFPAPKGGSNAGPWNYLRDADRALRTHHTGEAQQALEMAETRLLDRSTPADSANQPDQGPVVQQVSQARQALGHGDVKGARAAVRVALQSAPNGGGFSGSAAHSSGSQDSATPPGGVTTSSSTSSSSSFVPANQPGGAPNGNGTPTSAIMAPSGAGPAPGGNTAGARVGGGPAGTGTVDSAGGAK